MLHCRVGPGASRCCAAVQRERLVPQTCTIGSLTHHRVHTSRSSRQHVPTCFTEQIIGTRSAGRSVQTAADTAEADASAGADSAADNINEPAESGICSPEDPGSATWNIVSSEASIAGLVDVMDVPQSTNTIAHGAGTVGMAPSSPLTAGQADSALEAGPRCWDMVSTEASIAGIVDAIDSPDSSASDHSTSADGSTQATSGSCSAIEAPNISNDSLQQPAREVDTSDSSKAVSQLAHDMDSTAVQQQRQGNFTTSIPLAAAGGAGSIGVARPPCTDPATEVQHSASAKLQPSRQPIHGPPPEFSSLCGLAAAVVIASISNIFLCKPVGMSYSGQRIVKQCNSCCSSVAVQAQHHQYLQRQSHQLLPPLPLPVRQHLELDQLPPPSYKVPSLVNLSSAEAHETGIGAAAIAAQEWAHSRLAYHLQQLATANLTTKFLALWVVALPFILLFGSMYRIAARTTVSAAMYKVYALLYRVPGVGIAKEDNKYAYLVANMAFLVGTFTFAAIVGIVSDEIKTGIKNSRTGNYNMRLAGHILLLNWNSSSTALLRQIAMAYAEGGMYGNGAPWPWNNRPPVVVLADKRKAAMDEAVHEMLRDRGLQLEVHTREGNPFKQSDLRKVAAGKASTIIVQHPDSASSSQNAEAIKASIAMCLTALGPQVEQQRVVVQMTGPAPSEHSVLKSLGATKHLVGRTDIQSLQLPDSQLMHRLVVQTAAQPGILTCWLDILALANNSAQFYTVDLPQQLAQKTYMEVRRAFVHAVLCGYRAPGAAVTLNPAESDIVPADSKLIFLGRGGSLQLLVTPNSPLYDSAAASAAERLQQERTYKSKARNMLVANWPMSSIPELMEGFSMFTPNNSVITFTITGQPPDTWTTKLGTCRFNFISSEHPTSVKTLVEAGIKSVDAVVLGSGSALVGAPDMEADARILAAILQVQDAVLTSKRRDAPHLVAPIRRYATSKLASQYLEVLAAEDVGGRGSLAASTGAPLPPGAAATSTVVDGVPVAKPGSNTGGLMSLLGAHSSSNSGGADTSSHCPAAIICEPEFLVPNDVTSALMTQVVSEPAYSEIMKALLFTSDGMELYLRNPASFNIPTGVPLLFAEVEEAVRLTRQTAIGYIRSNSTGQHSVTPSSKCNKASKMQQQRKTVLGPSASHTVTFNEGDRIVVLAQDYAAAALT